MAKIVTVTFGNVDTPVPPVGWAILNYSAPQGGRTNIGVPMTQKGDGSMPTWEEIATLLGNNLGRAEWPDFIRGNVSGNAIRLMVPDEVDPIVFSAEFNPSLDQQAAIEPNPAWVVIAEESFGA